MEASPETFDLPLRQHRSAMLAKISSVLGLVASYASLNLLGRVVQMLTAFLVLRSLSKTDYAWYSLANNLVGALGMFTITGIGTGLMPLAGEVAHDRARLGSVLASAGRFRVSLLLFGSLAGLPVFVHLLLHSECPAGSTAVLVALAIISVMTSIASQMLATPLSLASRYNIPQWENVMSSSLRLAGVAALLFVGSVDAVSVMMITVLAPLPTLCGWLLPKARVHAAFEQQADPDATKRLRKHFFVGLPTSLTYLFEAQIAGLIIGFAGGIDKVADLGAISRVALLLQVPISVATGVLLPRMSAEKNLHKLRSMWISSSSVAVVSGAVILLGGWHLRHQLLLLLGPAYAGLEHELVFYLAFQVFAFITTVCSTPIQSRGWVRHSWVRPLLVFGSQSVAACFLDLSTVNGAIALMWAGSAGNLLLNVFLLFNGWRGRASL